MLYLEGSPIIIEAGALQKDNVTNKVLVQLKLRNISRRDIIACKAKIRAFEPGGKELDGVLDYTYLDVNKETGETFGVKNAIYLPNNNTRRFEAEITEVVFKDDSVWTSQDSEWIPIPRQKTIAEKLNNDDLIKQYEIEVGGNCSFYPEANNGLFMCTCGAMNVASSRCYKCGRNYTRLVEALDETTLKVKCAERLKKENEGNLGMAQSAHF
jgi:phage pi2 protein 07